MNSEAHRRAYGALLVLMAMAACAQSQKSELLPYDPGHSTLPSVPDATSTFTPSSSDGNSTSSTATLDIPPITAVGLANSPNYVAQVHAALQVLNIPPVNSPVAVSSARSRKFAFFNQTATQLWVGAAGDTHGNPLMGGGGWLLDANAAVSFTVPMPFTSARFWARPVCQQDPNNPTCASPTCTGPNQTQCTLTHTSGLTTLFEINMGSQGGDVDFYDISNVDAYNLPIAVIPVPGSYSGANPNDPFSCGSIAFAQDLDAVCPPPLQTINSQNHKVVDCTNQCGVDGLKTIPLCATCTGSGQCETNAYSLVFKTACPGCYSFSYDDATSTYACRGADYEVIFGSLGKPTFLPLP